VGVSRIRLIIGAISLKGFDGPDGKALVDGLERALAQTVADPTVRADSTRSYRQPVLRLGQAPLAPGPAGARRFGRNLATAIGKGLKP
jgi:hypothetical protein